MNSLLFIDGTIGLDALVQLVSDKITDPEHQSADQLSELFRMFDRVSRILNKRCIRIFVSLKQWRIYGAPRRAFPSDQIFLDFMQFGGKFNKIVSQRPLRVGAPCKNPGSTTKKTIYSGLTLLVLFSFMSKHRGKYMIYLFCTRFYSNASNTQYEPGLMI